MGAKLSPLARVKATHGDRKALIDKIRPLLASGEEKEGGAVARASNLKLLKLYERLSEKAK